MGNEIFSSICLTTQEWKNFQYSIEPNITMKNLLFTLLSLLVLTTSCAEEQECCQDLPTHYYDVAVIDANAGDLLDPNTPGAINPNGIRLFRLEGNKEIAKAFKGGEALDSPTA